MKIKFPILIALLLSVAFSVFAYSPYYTHPDLTGEIAKLFNFENTDSDREISVNEIRWMREGAIDEDTPPRWINHFYDPENKVGWQGKHFGDRTQEQGLYQGEAMAPLPAIASIDWVTNQEYQSTYGRQYGNQTWQKAIQAYIDGDKKSAFIALGHILHLIEDASVPDHTRNDTHADLFGDPGSPYEDYAKEKTNFNKLTIAENLKNKDLPYFSAIQDAFEHLAGYSNNNFFSEDTISNEEYALPDLKKLQKKSGYLYNEEKKLYLAKYTQDGHKILYTLNDKSLVLPFYFYKLSNEAVLTGASVLDLFFREVEKYKNNPELLPEIIEDSNEGTLSYLKKSPRLAVVNAGDLLDKAGTNIKIYANAFSSFSLSLLPAQLAGLIPAGAQSQPQALSVVASQESPPPAPALVPVTTVAVVADPIIPTPTPVIRDNVPAEPIAEPTASPVVPAIITDSIIPTSTDAVVMGTSVATTTDSLPPPAPIFRGSGSVTGVSPDTLVAQNNSSSPATEETQTTDTDAFATSTDDIFTETTATSTDSVTDDTATTTEDIIPTATSTDPIVTDPVIPLTDFTDSIVINEVAWMGTQAQANDEWVELYNKTNYDIDLSGWTLESRNKRFLVPLENVIPAHGYFLLERTASTTTDQEEGIVYSSNKGVLIDSGHDANLYLKNGTTTIDAIDFGYWPFASQKEERRSLERVSAYATSTLAANWKTYGDLDAVPFAHDAKGDDIFGTPGKKNSVSGFYTPTGYVTQDTVWKKEHSPYLVSTKIIINDDADLIIEPGVTVKFVNGGVYGGSIDVKGVLRAEGTIEEPIIFTSIRDDDADSIDSNRDGSASAPAAGDWLNVIFTGKSQVSVIKNAQVRYGGQGINYNPNGWYPTYTGVLSAQGGSVEISDSIIENNSATALYASKGSRPKIYQNTIQETVKNTSTGAAPWGAGIFIAADASAEITGNTIKNNFVGIVSESVTDEPLIVKDNIFDGNAKNGEFLKGYTNWNFENSGNEDVNKKGGFEIRFMVSDGQEKTLYADAMPYIVGDTARILTGGKLTIEPGVVIKFSSFSYGAIVRFIADGVLSAVGTEEKPIVFTALADDSDGYDSNNAPASPIAGAWKNIVFTGSTSSDSVLEYVHVRYGGQGENVCPYAYFGGPCMEYYGAISIDSADVIIRHVTLENNLGIAIFTEGVANPIIENSIIRDTQEARSTSTTTIGGYAISIGPDSEPILTDNTYANNKEDVVYRE